EVRATDDVIAGQALDFFVSDAKPERLQACGNLRIAMLARFSEFDQRGVEACRFRVDEIAEYMHGAGRILSADFDAVDEFNAKLGGGGAAFAETCKRIMIGDGNGARPCRLRQRQQFMRCRTAI